MGAITSNGNVILNSGKVIVNGGASLFTLPNMAWWVAGKFQKEVNNASIPALIDMSGNGNSPIQNTATNQPTMKTNILNGKSAVLFDGGNDYMTFSNLALHKNNPGITLYFCYARLLSSGTQYLLSIHDNGTSSRIAYFPNNASGNIQFSGRRVDGETASISNSFTIAGTTAHVVAMTWDYVAGKLIIYVDGNIVSSANAFSTGATNSNTDSFVNAFLGCTNPASSGFFNGYLFEAAQFNSSHSIADIRKGINYLRSEYAI